MRNYVANSLKYSQNQAKIVDKKLSGPFNTNSLQHNAHNASQDIHSKQDRQEIQQELSSESIMKKYSNIQQKSTKKISQKNIKPQFQQEKNQPKIIQVKRKSSLYLKQNNQKRYSQNIKIPEDIRSSIRRKSTLVRLVNNQADSYLQGAKLIFTFSTAICIICQNCFEKDKMSVFGDCDHIFCNSCIHQYLKYKISVMQDLTCPEQKCEEALTKESDAFNCLSQPLQRKAIRNQLYLKVSKDEDQKICPNDQCDEGFLNKNKNNENTVICSTCQKEYCFECLYPPHQGQCDNSDVKYIQSNFQFRQCSRCKRIIEKIEGCNHMTCPCKYQFCYLCGNVWNGNDHICSPIAQIQQVQTETQKILKILFKIFVVFPIWIICTILFLIFWLFGFCLLLVCIIFSSIIAAANATEYVCLCLLMIIVFPIALYIGVTEFIRVGAAKKYTDFFFVSKFDTYMEYTHRYLCS